jgi:SAM-dependent methyltransferase
VSEQEGPPSSGYAAVDDAPDPARLVSFLDHAAVAQVGMKYYAAATLTRRDPARLVADVGCGGGHDLDLLRQFGIRAVGVDSSRIMLGHAQRRVGPGGPLLQAACEALPFATGTLGGARIERVLMHVADPAAVVAEIARSLAPGALFTMSEPDWSRFLVKGSHRDENAGWIVSARHADVGGRLWELAEHAGCEVLDRIEELSVWRTLETLGVIVGGVAPAVERAVAAGRVERAVAEQWLGDQQTRDREGRYVSLMPKVMVVARR